MPNCETKVQTEENKTIGKYYELIDRVQKLTTLLEIITKTNRQLQRKYSELKNDLLQNEKSGRIEDLEKAVKKLKKENKTLKEKEKLIKTKIDRLTVKLNQIHI